MKQYFDFTVTGKQLLPAWLLIWVLVYIPNGVNQYISTMHLSLGFTKTQDLIYQLGLMLVSYLVIFFFIKKVIEGVRYKEHNVKVDLDFFSYLTSVLVGFLLTIVTLGFYSPWFIRKITRLFCNNSTLDSEGFQFLGSGGKLLLIMLGFFIPLVILLIGYSMYAALGSPSSIAEFGIIPIVLIITLAFVYYFYKWFVDVDYKDYHIEWETEFWDSFGVILMQLLLTIVTLGIYLPMAYLRLYEYFSERTIARSVDVTLQFGFEYETKRDFLFIWGQLLLTLVTLGIYYPWAFANVGKRFLSQTYLEKVEDE